MFFLEHFLLKCVRALNIVYGRLIASLKKPHFVFSASTFRLGVSSRSRKYSSWVVYINVRVANDLLVWHATFQLVSIQMSQGTVFSVVTPFWAEASRPPLQLMYPKKMHSLLKGFRQNNILIIILCFGSLLRQVMTFLNGSVIHRQNNDSVLFSRQTNNVSIHHLAVLICSISHEKIALSLIELLITFKLLTLSWLQSVVIANVPLVVGLLVVTGSNAQFPLQRPIAVWRTDDAALARWTVVCYRDDSIVHWTG